MTEEKQIHVRGLTTRRMTLCALFAALVAVGGFIRIPVPVCPFTLQTLFASLAGLLLGKRYGALSMALYLALGLAGLPIFTQGGGLGYVFKPTFGYLVGFCAGAYVTGAMVQRVASPSWARLLGASFAGLGVIYLIGMTYYYLLCNLVIDSPIGIGALLFHCFVLIIPGDTALCILGAWLALRIRPVLLKRNMI